MQPSVIARFFSHSTLGQKVLPLSTSLKPAHVPGLTVTAEVDYDHDGKFGDADNRNWTNGDKKNSVGGLLRSVVVGAVMDGFSRKVVALRVAPREPTAEFAVRLVRASS